MALIPKRRFKEFENEKEWEKRKIIDVAPLQRGFDLPVSKMVSGSYPVVMSNGIGAYHSKYKVKGPGVVTGRSGTLGNLTFITSDYWPHNTALWVTDFKGNVPKFIYYLYQKLDLKRYGTGSGVPTLNRNDVHKAIVKIPSIKEQSQIGSFFCDLDSLITLHRRKLEKLKDLKSAYLSEMFPQEGEKYPKRRFVGFTEPWEQRRLNEFTTYDISHFSANQFNENNIVGNYPVFDANNEIARIKEYEQAGEYISIIKDGAGVGRCELRPAKSSVIATMGYVKTKDSDIKFLYALMQNICWENFIKGSTIPHVYYKDYGKKVFAIPTLKEQKLIGSFFCDLDSLITLQERKLAKLSYLKSAYLSEMFV